MVIAQNSTRKVAILASYTASMYGISCAFECDEAVPVENRTLATRIYRIAQEAVTNSARHGKAENITLRLSMSESQIVMAVADDGIGISNEASQGQGLGMRTMRYRAESIGASLDISRRSEGGTIVRCCVPVREVEE